MKELNAELEAVSDSESESEGQSDYGPTKAPTSSIFSADSETGEIHNINIAFKQFKTQMTQIGNKYSGESDTLNEQYTDLDVKVLVSDETLEHQAEKRRSLGHKNPIKTSMYEQGKTVGSSIVAQKQKHCNPNKGACPSLPNNIKHIINILELLPSETSIAKDIGY